MGFRVHHLNCGTMCPRFARWVNGKGGVFDDARLLCHCLLVETNDGLLLVDTGLGVADVEGEPGRLPVPFRLIARPALRIGETALSQLKRLGFRREDVRHIVVTHLDMDHAGGLSDFPAATVHVHAVEHAAATSPTTSQEKSRYRAVQWEHGARWKPHAHSGESWHGFDSVRPLEGTTDDVLLVPLVGHSRGHCGVAVNTTRGWLLHAGDAYFARGEIHEAKATCPPLLTAFQSLVQFDGPARLRNQERLRELASGSHGPMNVISAHDPDEFEASKRTTRAARAVA